MITKFAGPESDVQNLWEKLDKTNIQQIKLNVEMEQPQQRETPGPLGYEPAPTDDINQSMQDGEHGSVAKVQEEFKSVSQEVSRLQQ
jgi:hypothetical protein